MSRSATLPLAAALALLLAAAAAAAGETPAPPGPPAVGVTRHEIRGLELYDAVVPGEVLSEESCGGALLILVRPVPVDEAADAPAAAAGADGEPPGAPASVPADAAPADGDGEPAAPLLLRLAIAGPGALEEVTPWVPQAVTRVLCADLDADGRPELLLAEPGRLWSLGSPNAPQPPLPVVVAPGADFDAAQLAAGGGRLEVPEVGRLRRFESRGGRLHEVASQPLPVEAARTPFGLRLTSPRLRRLPGAGGEAALLAVGPQASGDRRLRTLLLAAGGEPIETWSMLPEPESVEGSWLLRLDGRPVLAVTTFPANKLGIFAQHRLRLFLLGDDRTRAGGPPALAFETVSHRWQECLPMITDADGDGRDDLAVLQVKGLSGKETRLEVYPGDGAGGFGRRRRVDVGVAPGRWLYGRDFDGDRLPDLLLLDGDRLTLFSGTTGKRPLDRQPRLEIELPEVTQSVVGDAAVQITFSEQGASGEEIDVQVEPDEDGDGRARVSFGRPRADDLDGDGRAELVLVSRYATDGHGRIRIVRLP